MTWLGLNGVIVPWCSYICLFVTLLPWIAVSCASMFPVPPNFYSFDVEIL